MAKYFLHVKVFSRGRGSRVTRAAAYRAGERIRDDRTSEVYSYCDRLDVVHKEIMLPAEFAGRTDTNWARDRATLWNAAEHADRRNARLAREVLVTLPPELASAQRVAIASRFSRELAERYRCAVDVAVHQPRAGSDERHYHAHLLMTARQITPAGLGARTTLELSGRERHALGLGPSKEELLWVRERWAQVTNESLRAAGLEERIDHRSYKAQGVNQEPVPMMPQSVYYAERNSGVAHPAGDDIRARHRERIEARLKGSRALERVEQQQKKDGRQRALKDTERSAAVSRKTARAALSREELNRLRREQYRQKAPELNAKRREHERTHAAEINDKKREWTQSHRDQVNRQQREAYRKRRLAQGAVVRPQGPREASAIDSTQKSVTAAESLPAREAHAPAPASPTAEESLDRWLKSRESAAQSPSAEDSVRRWLESRERVNAAVPAKETAGERTVKRPGGSADDDEEDGKRRKRDRRRDQEHGL